MNGSDEAEQIRRDFATAWSRIGAAWGVSPSSAAVQGYLLLHGGPLTEADVRDSLGLSHRTALTALEECERWGLVERREARRIGRRGPASRSWAPVGDHWEWFRRVAAARKERETDPAIPLLTDCESRARSAGAEELAERIAALKSFIGLFGRGVDTVIAADAPAIAHLFGTLGQLDQATLDRLLATLATVPEADLARAITAVAAMRPGMVRRLASFAASPGVARILRSGS